MLSISFLGNDGYIQRLLYIYDFSFNSTEYMI